MTAPSIDVGKLLVVVTRGLIWTVIVDLEKGARGAAVQRGDRHWQRKHQSSDDGAEAGALLVVVGEVSWVCGMWLKGAVAQAWGERICNKCEAA